MSGALKVKLNGDITDKVEKYKQLGFRRVQMEEQTEK